MYEEQGASQGTIGQSLVIFLAGAAIGASLALLYAPTSGRTTRARIAEGAHQAKDTADGWRDSALSTAHETLDRAADTIRSASAYVNPNQNKTAATV